jgi:two-component system sensor histidine kinase/response regulator
MSRLSNAALARRREEREALLAPLISCLEPALDHARTDPDGPETDPDASPGEPAEGGVPWVLAGRGPCSRQYASRCELLWRLQREPLRESSLVELAMRNAELQREAEFKNRSLALVGQEMHSTLSALAAMLFLLKGTDLDEEQRGYVARVQGASQSLLRLADDLCHLARVGPQGADSHSTPFNLVEVLRRVSKAASAVLQGKPVEVRLSMPAGLPEKLVGDPLRLEEVLLNLVENAVRFTDRGVVEIVAETAALLESGIAIRFLVRDTGPGMTEEEQTQLLIALQRTIPLTGSNDGTAGLGLAICKQLVDLMGGELEIQSTPGMGSTIGFSIPFGCQARPVWNRIG